MLAGPGRMRMTIYSEMLLLFDLESSYRVSVCVCVRRRHSEHGQRGCRRRSWP